MDTGLLVGLLSAQITFISIVVGLGVWSTSLCNGNAMKALSEWEAAHFRMHQCKLAASLLSLLLSVVPLWIGISLTFAIASLMSWLVVLVGLSLVMALFCTVAAAWQMFQMIRLLNEAGVRIPIES